MDSERMAIDAASDDPQLVLHQPKPAFDPPQVPTAASDRPNLEARKQNEISSPNVIAEQPEKASSPADTMPVDEPRSSSPATDSSRVLNVTDALSYLDAVKLQFTDQPDVYNHFLDIMKEFKSQAIDTPGVIKRVSHLFSGHPTLIQGFNTFLPVGYRIECSDDLEATITVTTPSGTTMQTLGGADGRGPSQWSTTLSASDAASTSRRHGHAEPASLRPSSPAKPPPVEQTPYQEGTAMVPALQYVQKIKQRCEPEVYREFLDVLSQYHLSNMKEDEVTRRISRLFADQPDLRSEFSGFLSDRALLDDAPMVTEDPRGSKRKVESSSSAHTQKRKRREREKEKERDREREREREREKERVRERERDAASRSKAKRAVPVDAMKPATAPPAQSEDRQFFDRVKRMLDNRDVYNEFLKIVNLFTQGYINIARLIYESRLFLGDSELMAQWCDILGWDAVKDAESWSIERQKMHGYTRPMIAGSKNRPTHKDLHNEFGSYRKLPPHEANVTCSGRDEMCRSVLNDEWVSHPTWTSEDSGFNAHKKNIYEEALHRSEEERHEYDFHIDAVSRTITILEPLNNKISMMSPDERSNFKLKPNLCGPIHQRVIKKIYGRDCGVDVVAAIQETPSVAIPVVLTRLKQKEIEWRRAQREWDKVWREVDARNYVKSLDHQSINFKTDDRRAVSGKAFIHQIETARAEQTTKRASLFDPLFARTRPRHQLEFVIEDIDVLKDVLKLVFSFLDRTAVQVQEKRKVESFLRSYIPLFFGFDTVEFNKAFVAVQEAVDSDASDIDVGEDVEVSSVSSKASKGRKNGGGDLRKRLLKSEQAKSASNRKTRAQEVTSRFASPAVPADEESATAPSTSAPSQSTKRNGKLACFTNTNFYVLLRQIEVLYSRLLSFKNLSQNPALDPTVGVTSGEPDRDRTSIEHYYEFMLESCERLFDNEIEQNLFEDQMRYMFGVKEAFKIFTVDKVIGFIVKQVQTIIMDDNSKELLEALKKDRAIPDPTVHDQLSSRHNAERILGPDENMFRIDWLAESNTMTFQLLGKDDTSFEDTEVVSGRWQAYIRSFTSDDPTEKVPYSGFRSPFLPRNLRRSTDAVPEVFSSEKLHIKVCVRTYRLFFVSNTEDALWRIRRPAEVAGARKQLHARNLLRQRWLEKSKATVLSTEPQPIPALPQEPSS